jgi:hypothetical protein
MCAEALLNALPLICLMPSGLVTAACLLGWMGVGTPGLSRFEGAWLVEKRSGRPDRSDEWDTDLCF